MANIRIIPKTSSTLTTQDLAVINSISAVYPEESAWVSNAQGELTVSSMVPARSGAWTTRINLANADVPPLIEWKYSESEPGNAVPVVENSASRATLRVSNIDMQPDYRDVFPDSCWVKNGLDIIPRSR